MSLEEKASIRRAIYSLQINATRLVLQRSLSQTIDHIRVLHTNAGGVDLVAKDHTVSFVVGDILVAVGVSYLMAVVNKAGLTIVA